MKPRTLRGALQLLVAAVSAPESFVIETIKAPKGKGRIPTVIVTERVTHALDEARNALDMVEPRPAPIPMLLHCPECGERHIDEDGWEHRPHRDHACQACGHVWRPAHVDTVGVRFLPGYKNGDGVRLPPRQKRPHAVDKLVGGPVLHGPVSLFRLAADALNDPKRVILKNIGGPLRNGEEATRRNVIASMSNWAMRDYERAALAIARLSDGDDNGVIVDMWIDGKQHEHTFELKPGRP